MKKNDNKIKKLGNNLTWLFIGSCLLLVSLAVLSGLVNRYDQAMGEIAFAISIVVAVLVMVTIGIYSAKFGLMVGKELWKGRK